MLFELVRLWKTDDEFVIVAVDGFEEFKVLPLALFLLFNEFQSEGTISLLGLVDLIILVHSITLIHLFQCIKI